MPKWLGRGVITVDGIDIGYGEVIPQPKDGKKAEAFKKRVNRWVLKGLAGDPPEAISKDTEVIRLKEAESILSSQIEKLKAKIEEMELEKNLGNNGGGKKK